MPEVASWDPNQWGKARRVYGCCVWRGGGGLTVFFSSSFPSFLSHAGTSQRATAPRSRWASAVFQTKTEKLSAYRALLAPQYTVGIPRAEISDWGFTGWIWEVRRDDEEDRFFSPRLSCGRRRAPCVDSGQSVYLNLNVYDLSSGGTDRIGFGSVSSPTRRTTASSRT